MLMSDDDGARQDATMFVYALTALDTTTIMGKWLNFVLPCRMHCSNMPVRGWLTLCLHRGTYDLGHHMEFQSQARSA